MIIIIIFQHKQHNNDDVPCMLGGKDMGSGVRQLVKMT
jgi:hypothetical protein